MMRPSVGIWLWTVSQCEGGSTDKIVAKCLQYGIGHVLIKTNDGRSAYNGNLTKLVSSLRAARVNIWSWQYTYGKFPEEEAKAFADRSLALDVNGVCVDAEVEYKGNPGCAARYMSALNDALDGAGPVAVSSYYLPKNHPDFPWREFYGQAAYAMPQVYHYSNSPSLALRRSLDQHAVYKTTPVAQWVIPAGTITPEHHATPASVRAFFAEAEARGLGMVNLWSWQHATPALWQSIKRPV